MLIGIINPEILAKVVTILGISLSFLVSNPVAANEGFSSSLAGAPAAVQTVWPKTFAILTEYPDIYDIGTAALVWKIKKRTSWELYFLTANHVIDKACEEGKICLNTYLVQDLSGKTEGNKFFPDPIRWPYFDKVEIVERTTNPDLALIRVSADLKATGIPNPIPLPSICDLQPGQQLYTVGYPSTNSRVFSGSVPIADKDLTQKRWSSGVFTAWLVDGTGPDSRLYFGTTVDALQGNSGGPIVNSKGEMVGLSLKISDNSGANGFKYDGRETPGNLDWHSLSASCDYLQNLKANLKSGSVK